MRHAQLTGVPSPQPPVNHSLVCVLHVGVQARAWRWACTTQRSRSVALPSRASSTRCPASGESRGAAQSARQPLLHSACKAAAKWCFQHALPRISAASTAIRETGSWGSWVQTFCCARWVFLSAPPSRLPAAAKPQPPLLKRPCLQAAVPVHQEHHSEEVRRPLHAGGHRCCATAVTVVGVFCWLVESPAAAGPFADKHGGHVVLLLG